MSTETFLDPIASRISCDVYVRERVRGPEAVVFDTWNVVISIPANELSPSFVWVGLDDVEPEQWKVPEDWQMTGANCEKVAVEFIEKLKKEGLA